jgi:hypothetical protein
MTAPLDGVTKKAKPGPSLQEQIAEELVRRAREQSRHRARAYSANPVAV